MAKGRELLGIADLRKVRPLGKYLADTLQEHGIKDAVWWKTSHGHLRFTSADNRICELAFPTTPKSEGYSAKRSVAKLLKLIRGPQWHA